MTLTPRLHQVVTSALAAAMITTIAASPAAAQTTPATPSAPEVTSTPPTPTPAGSEEPAASSGSPQESSPSSTAADECKPLQVVAIQGTGESSPTASKTTASGFLGDLVAPILNDPEQAAGVAVTFVPYDAAFGGSVTYSKVPYADSVTAGVKGTEKEIRELSTRCPTSRFAVIGYSQGAHVASKVLLNVAAGTNGIPAELIAMGALIGSPTRDNDSPLFPGAPAINTPLTPAGVSAEHTGALEGPTVEPASGQGVGPTTDKAATYGVLTGRVAQVCAAGDLSCATPENSAILKTAANIAGSSQVAPGDPIGSLFTLSEALASTTIKTAVNVINKDVSGTTLDNLSYSPAASLSARIEQASDPRTKIRPQDALIAVMKVGTIGFNAALKASTALINPGTIGAIARVGAQDWTGAAASLAGGLLEAAVDVVPPTTAKRWVQEGFTALTSNVVDNAGLLDVALDVNYWNQFKNHKSYSWAPINPAGDTMNAWIAKWISALAADLAASSAPTAAVSTPTGAGTEIVDAANPFARSDSSDDQWTIPGLEIPEIDSDALRQLPGVGDAPGSSGGQGPSSSRQATPTVPTRKPSEFPEISMD